MSSLWGPLPNVPGHKYMFLWPQWSAGRRHGSGLVWRKQQQCTTSISSRTDLAMLGSPHSVLSSLVLCSRPSESTLLSKTSTPNTLGFIGLGYFCIAALVTVSHGWLWKAPLASDRACFYTAFDHRESKLDMYMNQCWVTVEMYMVTGHVHTTITKSTHMKLNMNWW